MDRMCSRSAARGALLLAACLTLASSCRFGGRFAEDSEPIGLSGNAHAPAYQPISPATIWVDVGELSVDPRAWRSALLGDLSNESVLFTVADASGQSGLSFGPARVSAKGRSYDVVVDYVKYHTLAVPIVIRSVATPEQTTAYRVDFWDPADPTGCEGCTGSERLVYVGPLPVYAGVGLRIQAHVRALESGVKLSSLSSIGLDAQADRLSGTLSIHTLGINSEKISTLLPLETELSQSAIVSTIKSLVAIKSNIYSADTIAHPQILGFQSPLQDRVAVAQITKFVYQIDYELALERRALDGSTETAMFLSWPRIRVPAGPATRATPALTGT